MKLFGDMNFMHGDESMLLLHLSPAFGSLALQFSYVTSSTFRKIIMSHLQKKTPYPMPNVHVFPPKTSPKNQASRFPPQKNQASSCRKGWNIRASGPTFGASMASPGCFSSWPPLQSCAWDALSAWRPRIWRCSCGPRRDEAGSCEMRWLIVDFMFFFENHEVFTVDLCRFMLIYVYLDFPFHPLWCRLLDVISFLSMFCSVHVRFGLRKQEVQLHIGAI